METEAFDFVETDAAKIYTTIIGNLMDSTGEALYPGDERRIFGEALVSVFILMYNEFNDKMKQRTLKYARNTVLDAIGERYGVGRATPTPAQALFRFSLDAPYTQNIIIDEGTKVTSNGDIYFTTNHVAVIQAGEQYIDIQCTCTAGGEMYNGIAVGTITTLVDLIPYISRVENITATSGGDDGEPYDDAGDERYRQRIRLAPATQSTAGPESAYRYWALSADPDIADVTIDSPEANIINIYPLMKNGEIPDNETVEKISNVFADDVRPMTDLVTVLKPTQVEYDVEFTYYCTHEDEADTIKTIEGAGGSVDQYNAWQTAALGRDINPDQLRRVLLCPEGEDQKTGALRVEIVKPEYRELTKKEIAKFSGNITISHEITEG